MGFSIDASEVEHLAADLAAAPAKVEAKSVVAVSKSGHELETAAKGFAPVRTGALKASISGSSTGLEASVTAHVRYSGYVEYGTSDTRPQPFMRPALDVAAPGLEDGLGDAGEDIL